MIYLNKTHFNNVFSFGSKHIIFHHFPKLKYCAVYEKRHKISLLRDLKIWFYIHPIMDCCVMLLIIISTYTYFIWLLFLFFCLFVYLFVCLLVCLVLNYCFYSVASKSCANYLRPFYLIYSILFEKNVIFCFFFHRKYVTFGFGERYSSLYIIFKFLTKHATNIDSIRSF